MTKVLFFHGAGDRLQAAVAWLSDSYRQHKPVLVYAPDPVIAERLDRLLWTHPSTGFLPHARTDDPLARETPVLIASHLETLPQEECLLNLSNEVPPGFSRFSELVEIVSDGGDDRLPARDRFKFYRERGYDLASQKFDSKPA